MPAIDSLSNGWAEGWRSLGVAVAGWGWVEGDPIREAELAVYLCTEFNLDGYIANAEDPYEGPANYWKHAAFVKRFRELAPRAPLAISYIGYGNPHRDFPIKPWLEAGAVLMPQCYWATVSTSIEPSLWAASNWPAPKDQIVPTLGTSGFQQHYPPYLYKAELQKHNLKASNVWLLESTTDDTLRTLYA